MASAQLEQVRPAEPSGQTARIWERFLTEPTADLVGVRPVVARSWYRSRAAGVDATADRGVFEDGRIDAHTLRIAEPILRRLDDFAADLGGYATLTAPNGSIMDTDFLRYSEGFPAGYSLLEEHCGSNGEGLALEEGRSVWLAPEEHFREDMRRNWCFASLVRDPFHSRVRAVIALTFPANRVRSLDPASTLLMLEGVAAEVTREIEARASADERLLLNEYLTVSRRRGGSAVLATDGKNTLMNAVATATLEEGDFAVVSSYAKDVMTASRGTRREVHLRGLGLVTLEVSPVPLTQRRAGAIVVIRPRAGLQEDAVRIESGPPRPIPPADGLDDEFDGVSAELDGVLDLARKAIAQRRHAILVGESGTGRARLAAAIARRLGDALEIDCLEPESQGLRFSQQIRRIAAAPPSSLIVKNADALLRPQAQELVRTLKAITGTRVLMTVARPTDATMLVAEACDLLEIPLSPLRSRREDIPVLAEAFARELGDRRLSRRLLTALTNADWPRNIDQLRVVVSNAVERARGAEVTVDDLPQGFQRVVTGDKLSRLEDAELSELRAALQEARGNRRLAAELLQIGRSTLYRRMDYFKSRGLEL